MPVLVSCTSTVKVWTLPEDSGENATKEFDPGHGRISAVAWNHTGKVLATVGEDGTVALVLQTGQELCRLPVAPAAGTEKFLAVRFGPDSRYLVTGGTAGLVKIWDLKRKDLIKSLTGHSSAVTSVAFSSDGMTVASGSVGGDLILHSLLKAVCFLPPGCTTQLAPRLVLAEIDFSSAKRPEASRPLKHDGSVAAIRSLQFSPFRKNLLAAVGDDGILNLWDTSSMSLHHSFGAVHSSAATGVCFSPFNHLLICTVGADSRLVFKDIEDFNTVKEVVSDAPLTALSFMDDGVTVAVGTSRGLVHVYNLRTEQLLQNTLVAREGTAVAALAFQRVARKSKETARVAVPTAVVLPPKVPVPSALQSEMTNAAISADKATASAPAAAAVVPVPASGASALVPVQRQVKFAINKGPTTPQREPPSATSTPAADVNSLSPTVTDATATTLPSAGGQSPTVTDVRENPQKILQESTQRNPDGAAVGNDSQPASDHNSGVVLGNVGSVGSGLSSLQPGELGFQGDFIKSIVKDCLIDFRMGLHREVQNLHVDMIRQFQIQKNEMEIMFTKMSVNESLVREIERLRSENEVLKQRF